MIWWKRRGTGFLKCLFLFALLREKVISAEEAGNKLLLSLPLSLFPPSLSSLSGSLARSFSLFLSISRRKKKTPPFSHPL